MKLHLALPLAAALALATPAFATPTFDDTPVAEFGSMPIATDLQDEFDDESSAMASARQDRTTSDPGSGTGGSFAATPLKFSSFAAAAADPIPEPSTALLLAPAAALFVLSRRWR